MPDGAPHMLARQDRRRLALERGQIVHEIVERLQRAVPGVAQHLVEPTFFGFAGKQRDAKLLRLADLRRHFRQHRDAARHMEAADADRQAGVAELARKIDRARKLVGLHADEADQARPPALRISRMIRSGRTRRLVSS